MGHGLLIVTVSHRLLVVKTQIICATTLGAIGVCSFAYARNNPYSTAVVKLPAFIRAKQLVIKAKE